MRPTRPAGVTSLATKRMPRNRLARANGPRVRTPKIQPNPRTRSHPSGIRPEPGSRNPRSFHPCQQVFRSTLGPFLPLSNHSFPVIVKIGLEAEQAKFKGVWLGFPPAFLGLYFGSF